MAKRLQYKRLLMLALLLFAAFAGLGYRLVDLQLLRHDDLSEEARSNTRISFPLEPHRGDIRDIKGNLLATSVAVKTVCADPTLLAGHEAEVARVLAPLLQLNEAELIQKLSPRVTRNKTGQLTTNMYVKLKSRVSTENWAKISNTMSQLTFNVDERKLSKKDQAFYRALRTKAIYTERTDGQLRTYPGLTLAAQVIGYTSPEEVTNSAGEHITGIKGMDGIERYFDTQLKGVYGRRVTERDRRENELVVWRDLDVEPQNGLNVVLTIDSVLQHILETELAAAMEKDRPETASGIIIRPKTGEILAMASVPTFDPNNLNGPERGRRNVLISDIHEPGSTFKIVVVSGALNDQIIRMSDVFDCEHGRFAYAGHVLHDHVSLGTLSAQGIITKSSNIGAAKIGIKMGQDRLRDYMLDFGFGEKTGIQLVGENHGIVHKIKDWTKVSIAQIPMGQGVAVTSLQMTMAMCAIANKGVLMRPILVNRVEDEGGNALARFGPQEVHRVISEETARQMVAALKTVATKDGTAVQAKLDNFTVAGKTGTAQIPPYTENKYYASFIGFFPADNPEICIYIALEKPQTALHQGGQVAAPIFNRVAVKAANYLNIHPDSGGEPVATELASAADSGVPAGSAGRVAP